MVERDISECETRREVERRAPVDLEGMSAYLKEQRKARGLSQKAVDEFLGTNTLYSWFEGRAKGIQAPTPEVWAKLKEVLGLDDRFDEQINGTVLVEVTVDRGGDRGDSAPSRGQILPARVTTGWEPTCEHADAPTRPCAVLDPFAGSGTTGAVALREGCSFVGIELNPDYVALAERRIAAAAPSLFCTRTP